MEFIFFEHSFDITKGNHNTVFVKSFICVDDVHVCPSQQFFRHGWATSWHVIGHKALNIDAPIYTLFSAFL